MPSILEQYQIVDARMLDISPWEQIRATANDLECEHLRCHIL